MSSSSLSPSSSTRSATSPTSPTSSTSIISPATSTSTDQSFESLPWILHHILETNAISELPIRIMFAANRGQSLPRLKDIYTWWQLDPQGKLILSFLSAQNRIIPSIADATAADINTLRLALPEPKFDPLHCSDDRFMDHGNDALLNIGFAHLVGNAGKENIDFNPQKRPKGLPAHFVQKYCLDNVFVPEFTDVNFDHALTALDYLRDLEYTRRNAMREAAVKLGITEQNWRRVLWGNQRAMKWVEQTQGNELRIETMYADLFIDLRIWTMTSILLANKFNKTDALAMLNTLFPPALQDLPNSKINPKVLYQQRAIFYRYTIDVEENGPGVMNDFKKHLSQPDNRHRWPSVRGILESYTTLAEKMINEASDATEMLQQQDAKPLSSSKASKPIARRAFTATSFGSPRTEPETPKAKSSVGDLRRFALNKKPSQVFGENKIGVYSKSMVNVSMPEMGSSIKSSVDLSTRTLDPSRTTPSKSQPTFDNMSSSRNLRGRKPNPSSTILATSPSEFDNLFSTGTRAHSFSKPLGFVPPPLDDVDKMMGRTSMPSPWDALEEEDEDDDAATANPTRKVSFDFDAALGVGKDSGRPFLPSGARNFSPSRKAKPNLQINTEKVTSKQQDVSPTVKSARAFPKFEERSPTPLDLRPQTADSPSIGRRGFKSRAASGKLYSAFESRQAEPLPPFATLPIKRRQFPEPALMPEPLMINRPRKAITPRTPNVNLFPPRNINTNLAFPPHSPASNSPIWDSNRTVFDSPTQDNDEFSAVKKVFSSTSATASRPSTSSEISSKPTKNTPTDSSSASHLPSDNLAFLNRPYTGSSSDTDIRSPVVMKKSSFANIFRRKKSAPVMADEFSRGDGLGISTETVPRQSGEVDDARLQIKKKSSIGAFLPARPREKSKWEREHRPVTPRVDDGAKTNEHGQQADTIFQESDENPRASKAVIKKKSSIGAFLHGKSHEISDELENSRSQQFDEGYQAPKSSIRKRGSVGTFLRGSKSRDLSKSNERENQSTASMARGSEDSGGKRGILKKQDSMGTFMRGTSTDMAEHRDFNDLPIKTPTSGKSARFEDDPTASTSNDFESRGKRKADEGPELKAKKSHNFVNSLRSSESTSTLRQDKGKGKEKDTGETAEPEIKKTSSFSFGNLRSSASKTRLSSQQTPEDSEQPRGLKKMSSLVFGPPGLRTSDSQSTLRPERNVLRKKKSAYAVGGSTPAPSSSAKFAANADVGVFAQFEAELADRRFGSFANDQIREKDRADRLAEVGPTFGAPIQTRDFTSQSIFASGSGSGSGSASREETSFESGSTGQTSPPPALPRASLSPFVRDPRDYEEEEEENEDDVFGGVGSASAVGGFGGSGGRRVKKKKSVWGAFGGKDRGEEKEREEKEKREKEEKRRRVAEERVGRVLHFAR